MNLYDDLTFIQVHNEIELIESIYSILKACGKDMYLNQGLEHWKNPYLVESISKDCIEKQVYIVKQDAKAVATFQLKQDDLGMLLSKFAVLPWCSSKGIGHKCLQFMVDKCTVEKVKTLHLDVYDKSEKAIRFYLNNGFEIIGSAPTRRFRVLVMEKHI